MSSLTDNRSAAVGRTKNEWRPSAVLRRYTFSVALLLSLLLLVVNLVLRPTFDVESQFAAFAPLAIAAIASTPAIVSGRGGLDMSISPLMSLAGIVYVAWLAPAGLGGIIAVPIVLALGAAVGTINGLLIVGLRLQPVVATLAMFFIIGGVNLKLAPQPVQVSDTWLKVFAGSFGPVPGGLIIIAVPAVIWGLLARSSYGRTLYTVGGNDAMAFSAGIPVGATRVFAYALGGLFAAIGGLALTGLVGSASAGTSASYTLIAIAAVVLGGTSLAGGRGGVLGAILGAATIFLLQNVLAAMQVSQVWLQVIYGAMLLFAVVVGAQISAHPRAPSAQHPPLTPDSPAVIGTTEEST